MAFAYPRRCLTESRSWSLAAPTDGLDGFHLQNVLYAEAVSATGLDFSSHADWHSLPFPQPVAAHQRSDAMDAVVAVAVAVDMEASYHGLSDAVV